MHRNLRYLAKRKLGRYFQENFRLTNSGKFRTQSLIDAVLEIGADRIKIGRTNAVKLFKLEVAA